MEYHKGKNKRVQTEESYNEGLGLGFREAKVESWDFKRNQNGNSQDEGRFSYNKRQPDVDNYRVLGKSSTPQTDTHPNKLRAKTRPNRYNASVKMVAGDSGPAPWDWESVSYKKMPVVGEVAAGRYDVTVAFHEAGQGADADFVMIDPHEIKVERNCFALRVRGQSMIDNEIDDGDIIIVQAQDWAEDGDFVIACLTDSTDPLGFVTLKRFYRHRFTDRVLLQPANQSLSPIHILPRKGDKNEDLDGVKIQGKVTAIIKNGGNY